MTHSCGHVEEWMIPNPSKSATNASWGHSSYVVIDAILSKIKSRLPFCRNIFILLLFHQYYGPVNPGLAASGLACLGGVPVPIGTYPPLVLVAPPAYEPPLDSARTPPAPLLPLLPAEASESVPFPYGELSSEPPAATSGVPVPAGIYALEVPQVFALLGGTCCNVPLRISHVCVTFWVPYLIVISMRGRPFEVYW